MSSFQFTRPRGARRVDVDPVAVVGVSIHAPAWGATTSASTAAGKVLFQFTRPRGARPVDGEDARRLVEVSIHAPAWGATTERRRSKLWGSFNSRARVGRDLERSPKAKAPRSFNSRARVGRDGGVCVHAAVVLVSIHAPAWGATSPLRALCVENLCFNSRARVGRDVRSAASVASDLFQFTRPRGARHRVGGEAQFVRAVSIHAPAWGATLAHNSIAVGLSAFQFTRPRGARLLVLLVKRVPNSFNSRARVGRDRRGRGNLRHALVSIHAPAWGATLLRSPRR